MDQNKNDIRSTQQGVPVMLVAQPIELDEINLYNLFHTLAKHKYLIIACTGIAVVIGLLYAFIASPIFQSEVTLAPPHSSDIVALQGLEGVIDDTRPSGSAYTPAFVYKKFISTLNSKTMRMSYFFNNGVKERLYPNAKSTEDIHEAFISFDKAFNWDAKSNTLKFSGHDPVFISKLLNDYVKNAAQATRSILINDLQAELLNDRQHIQDKISRIELALSLAKKMGITVKNINNGHDGDLLPKQFNIALSKSDIPLYLHELSLPNLKAELEQMKNISAKGLDFRVMNVDSLAFPPKYHIKPKRTLVVIASFVAGIVFGILVVFFVEAYTRSRALSAYAKDI